MGRRGGSPMASAIISRRTSATSPGFCPSPKQASSPTSTKFRFGSSQTLPRDFGLADIADVVSKAMGKSDERLAAQLGAFSRRLDDFEEKLDKLSLPQRGIDASKPSPRCKQASVAVVERIVASSLSTGMSDTSDALTMAERQRLTSQAMVESGMLSSSADCAPSEDARRCAMGESILDAATKVAEREVKRDQRERFMHKFASNEILGKTTDKLEKESVSSAHRTCHRTNSTPSAHHSALRCIRPWLSAPSPARRPSPAHGRRRC